MANLLHYLINNSIYLFNKCLLPGKENIELFIPVYINLKIKVIAVEFPAKPMSNHLPYLYSLPNYHADGKAIFVLSKKSFAIMHKGWLLFLNLKVATCHISYLFDEIKFNCIRINDAILLH